MDFDKKLPLLDISLIPASDTSRLVRSKSRLAMARVGLVGGDDGNDSRPQPNTESRNRNTCTQSGPPAASGLGFAGVWVPIRNDAIERPRKY